MTNTAFISAVEHREDPRILVVRARLKGDLEAFFGKVIVTETPDADYRFRTYVSREQLKARLAETVDAVNYPNFKSSVKDHDRHMAYMDVWSAMFRAQRQELARRFPIVAKAGSALERVGNWLSLNLGSVYGSEEDAWNARGGSATWFADDDRAADRAEYSATAAPTSRSGACAFAIAVRRRARIFSPAVNAAKAVRVKPARPESKMPNVNLMLTAEGALAVREFLIDCGADSASIWDDFQARCPHNLYTLSDNEWTCDACDLVKGDYA